MENSFAEVRDMILDYRSTGRKMEPLSAELKGRKKQPPTPLATGDLAEIEILGWAPGPEGQSVCSCYLSGRVARKLTSWHTTNRAIRPGHVDYLSRQQAGEAWAANGSTISWSGSGWDDLGEGQDGGHRLASHSRLPDLMLHYYVVFGVDPDAWATIDKHSRRSMKDALSRDGVKNASDLSALLTSLWYFWLSGREVLGQRVAGTPTYEHLQVLLDAYPSAPDVAGFVKSEQNTAAQAFSSSTMALLVLLETEEGTLPHLGDTSRRFVRAVRGGYREPGDAVDVFLQYWIKRGSASAKRGSRVRAVSEEEAGTQFARAWNAYATGGDLRVLRSVKKAPPIFGLPKLRDLR